jgi:major membrane immunogen (membrane-anchored lipoprotein)
MAGLARLCKIHGSVKFKDKDGKEIIWLYDYANDEPRLKSEMTKEEIAASEKAKWKIIANNIKNAQ